MALPTTTDNRAALSLDELISELNTPRQEFEPPPNAEPREPVAMPGDYSKRDPEAAEKVSAETAAAAGKEFAAMAVNSSQALCGFIADEKGEKYKVSKSQENDLAESYAKVAALYSISGTNPLLQAAIMTVFILGPEYREAFKDRRYKAMQEEQKRQADEQKRQDSEQKRQALEMLKMRDFIEKEKANGQQPASA